MSVQERTVGRRRPMLALLFATTADAADMSVYCGFRVGMTVSEVAAAAALSPTSIKTVHQRPLLMQALERSPPRAPVATGTLPVPDSVERVVFGFCGGGLYRVVVVYDADSTAGLTDEDLIDALSAVYGQATRPVTKIITSAASQSYVETEEVRARWEDAASSVNLYSRACRSTFGLVIYSKKLGPVVRAALVEASRLADLDAPRREIAAQKLRDDTERDLYAKARSANKAAFRY